MKLLEVLLMTLAGLWQGLRQDFNLLEIALVILWWWAWKRGRLPKFPSMRVPERPWLSAILLAAGAVALRLALVPVLPAPGPLLSHQFLPLLLPPPLLPRPPPTPTHPLLPPLPTLHIL